MKLYMTFEDPSEFTVTKIVNQIPTKTNKFMVFEHQLNYKSALDVHACFKFSFLVHICQ